MQTAPTVVLINDDATQLATLSGFLENAGYPVLPFVSAEEALAACCAAPPGLIVTDLYMPGLDGWRLCRLLRSPEYPALNRVPILVVSATFSGEEPSRITTGLGANAFLTSPVESSRFIGLVRQLLAGDLAPVVPNVLIVEDDQDLAQLLADAFTEHGWKVRVALSGEEARRRVREEHPDTVILDFHLPDMNSDSLLTELTAVDSPPAVVTITGDVDPELALRLMKLGARGYARKPFKPEYVLAVCQSVWRERCLLRVEPLLEQRTRELRESEERFRVMAEHAPAMIFLFDSQARVHHLNRAALEFKLGHGARGKPTSVGAALGCSHAQGPAGCGASAACEQCQIRGIILETFQTGLSCRKVEVRKNLAGDARGRDLVLLVSSARVEVSARPMVLLCIEDVTERRLLEDQLRQSQKMEAIGQLAGGVAHDFNNILAAMLLQIGLIQDATLSPELQSILEQLEKGANRAAGLTRQLLMFSRRQIMQTKPLELNDVLSDLLKMLRRLLGEQIDLTFERHADPLWIDADRSMIEQIVLNLSVNARDAMPQGGRLDIRTTTVVIGPSDTRSHPQARPGEFVCLSVQDNGSGMDQGTLARLFEPFFTTKEVGQGTGLGLATAYGIVSQHRGWIEVKSSPGQGSTFCVYLPLRAEAPLPISGKPLAQTPRGNETLLFVEDDDSVRRTAASLLRLLGYEVIEAGTGAEALEQWHRHNGQISLLLADMVMPGKMSGLDLAECLRLENPRLKVIISSGYSLEMLRQDGPRSRAVTFLPKPYEASALATVVRQCLDQPIPIHVSGE